MADMEKIVKSLESIGISNYESKAFASLLEKHPVTGYQLSKNSGVPSSRIYETLEKLITKGFVVQKNAKPNLYLPISAEDFLDRTQNDVIDKVAELKNQITALGEQKLVQPGIWNVEGKKNVKAKISELIDKSKSNINICGWAEDIGAFKEALDSAISRGVGVIVISYGEVELEGKFVKFQQNRNEVKRDSLRDILLLVDKETILSGTVFQGNAANVAVTQEPSMVYHAREFMMHKVLVGKTSDSYPDAVKDQLNGFYMQD